MMSAPELPTTRPYLIRALYEWCGDNGWTPYIAVLADQAVQVPREFVQNGEIVLNISCEATSGLKLGNEFIEFKARFGGIPREILVPVDRVMAIYARENGQGMAFPMQGLADASTPEAPTSAGVPVAGGAIQLVPPVGMGEEGSPEPTPPSSAPQTRRPALKRIK